MKTVCQVLRIVMGALVGTFLGSSLYRVLDYRARPGLYAMQSAPWYTSILVQGAFTAAMVAVLLLCMWLIKKRIK